MRRSATDGSGADARGRARQRKASEDVCVYVSGQGWVRDEEAVRSVRSRWGLGSLGNACRVTPLWDRVTVTRGRIGHAAVAGVRERCCGVTRGSGKRTMRNAQV